MKFFYIRQSFGVYSEGYFGCYMYRCQYWEIYGVRDNHPAAKGIVDDIEFGYCDLSQEG